MSDKTRQSLSERMSAAITPDAAKSDERIARENIRGGIDAAQAAAQPEGQKSYLQKAADTVRDMTEGTDTTGMRSSAQQSWEDTKQSASDTAQSASDRMHSATTGGAGYDPSTSGSNFGMTNATTANSPSGVGLQSHKDDEGLFEKAKHLLGMDTSPSSDTAGPTGSS